MSVRFTNEHIYVQFIDDAAGVTLAAASTCTRRRRTAKSWRRMSTGAKTIGTLAAEAAKGKGIKAVVFDRGGARITAK